MIMGSIAAHPRGRVNESVCCNTDAEGRPSGAWSTTCWVPSVRMSRWWKQERERPAKQRQRGRLRGDKGVVRARAVRCRLRG
ncbi:hypothetical protein B0H17DRAFT_1072093 [Mycena rosella]|uniref:Uncharacterized protein n=1 Tax=Mycena rosella TaxID=1033263 RepID=A0AAD7DA49_MYCRO|nr:hypothetical protein B0H17DRAFT_1072093 [Mycena rosella]